ncbi:hypothetical protein CY34DRAFT_806262 [Suillus luteus UH-Slu-Lm8-n1]|uniref:Uncharacterized protein n=1 Tax=Suillus luteus UH-Slu-Lm8-n1 TaxID=930992 RepID=A0A0D0B478_9AGAM|nr:hypothetical protein CY34DRAFT_806262 [Suillus luteus UH-Slu-Lm8-n1]
MLQLPDLHLLTTQLVFAAAASFRVGVVGSIACASLVKENPRSLPSSPSTWRPLGHLLASQATLHVRLRLAIFYTIMMLIICADQFMSHYSGVGRLTVF